MKSLREFVKFKKGIKDNNFSLSFYIFTNFASLRPKIFHGLINE